MTDGPPRLLIITDRHQVPPSRTLGQTVAEALSAGARHILVRERDLDAPDWERLADELRQAAAHTGAVLLVASPAPVGPREGLHLRSTDPVPTVRPRLLGRSVHNPAEAARAARDRCDYMTVSPIAATRSKPGYGPALGVHGLRRLLAAVPDAPPALALAGVLPHQVQALRGAGAYGVAVMGAIMRAADPAATVATYLRHLT